MRVFRGFDQHTLDAKGRVSMPAKYRKVLPENLVVVRSLDDDYRSLSIFTEEAFENWLESLFAREGGFDSNDLRHVDKMSKFTDKAQDVEVDKAGRINIPANLRDYASLDKDVVIVGANDHIKIWDADTYRAYDEYRDANSVSRR
ncbi:MAG: division/cell wall cluster transcriptional repressor MraZ [Coriobacteriaceae bacterium]|nr:division/cell wall cluster transcriptional repressor MraZ [Coriobacteriaceae bacterium]